MNLLNTLIIGWSIVWAGALILMGTMLSTVQVGLVMWGTASGIGNRTVYLCSLAIYSFGVWAIGCAIICAVVFGINKARRR